MSALDKTQLLLNKMTLESDNRKLTSKIEKLEENNKKVLKEVVSAIHFNDNSDFHSALWRIAEILGGQELCDVLEYNSGDAYEIYTP